jgi:hypothetical protein
MDVGTGLFNNNGEDDFAYGFPDNVEMIPANGGVVGGTFVENTLGAAIGRDSEWDIEKYFEVNYDYDENVTSDTNGLLPHPSNVTSAFSGMMPSRYDVHLAEIANKWNEVRAPDIPGYPAGSGESGEPMCGITSNPSREPVPTGANPASERRLIVGAIVDCGSQGGSTNGQSTLTVNSYGSFFMTRPMISYYSGYDATIDIEVVDITGFGGNGTLDEFIRTEAILVR